MPKRKYLSTSASAPAAAATSTVVAVPEDLAPPLPPAKKRASGRKVSQTVSEPKSTNPDVNDKVLDGPEALRASPDASARDERMNVEAAGMDAQKQIKKEDDDTATSKAGKGKEEKFLDPEAEGDEEANEEELKEALSRPPPVHSDYLPLPWKGRLGYACLNTYLRFSNPPIFSSRTCRIASILENRHPLTNPDEPPHPTKNRPDRTKPADHARGQAFVESLGKANARDIVKMLQWNDKYGIKFLRLSSEMFPFASHDEYGYKLEPFVSEELAEAGRVAAQLGHRLTTHPGQFTQLGSPRKQVIDNAIRDLDYHAELLSLLKLPPQQDRDAVMILHLGGVFGDKEATLDRFRTNYARLSPGVKKRLVLENDDVSWSVHDLLPVCEELNIPMVLDYHHHNIIFDADKLREGTKDIMDLYPRILATWKRKNITPKMHYSEPTPAAITGRQRRKHNPRVATLPPCPPDMDLMIEAKDKEQAVFELMRTFKLPGYDTFNDITPHVRLDDDKSLKAATATPKKKTPKKKKVKTEDDDDNDNVADEAGPADPAPVAEADIGMGGPENRVYWPPTMEHWLRPAKRVVKPKPEAVVKAEGDEVGANSPAKKKKTTKGKATAPAPAAVPAPDEAVVEETPAPKSKAKAARAAGGAVKAGKATAKTTPASKASEKKKSGSAATKKKNNKKAKVVLTPSTSDANDHGEEDEDEEDESDEELSDLGSGEEEETVVARGKKRGSTTRPSMASANGGRRQSGRATKGKMVSYAEE